MVSEHDKKRLTEEQQGRIGAIDASVQRGVMSMDEGHKQAEAIRSTAGYSGGVDGSEYIPLSESTNKNASNGFDASALVSAPAGKSNKWQQSLEDAAKNYVGMSYSDFVQSDDYASLAKRYSAQGQKAMQNTLGEVAARTGGLASSYATVAAQQQYNDFMSRLEDAARSMYDAKRGEAAENVGMLQSMYDNEENRNQYLTDLAHTLDREKIADTRYENELQRSILESDQDRMDAKAKESYEKMLLRAETLAQSGNFDGYRALGYTDADIASLQKKYDDDLAYEKALRNAELAELYDGVGGGSANPFDFSETYAWLDDLGVENSEEAKNRLIGAGYSDKEAEAIAMYYTPYTSFVPTTKLYGQYRNVVENTLNAEDGGNDAAWQTLDNYVQKDILTEAEANRIAAELGITEPRKGA